MKPIKLFIPLLFSAGISVAQPVTTTDYLPAVGNTGSLKWHAQSVPILFDTGQNQVWTLNFHETLAAASFAYSRPTNLPPDLASASLKNIIRYNNYPTAPGYLYDIGPQGLVALAFLDGTGSDQVFTRRPIHFPVGLSLGQRILFGSTVRRSSSPLLYSRSVDTLQFSGTGTLIADGHQWSDVVMLVHTYSETDFGPDTTSAFNPHSFVTSIQFWSPGFGYPVLEYRHDRANTSPYNYTFMYLDGGPLAVQALAKETLPVSPNPATSTLTLPDLPPATYLYAISAQGTNYPLVPGSRVDIAALPPGLYTLVAGNRRARFVKE